MKFIINYAIVAIVLLLRFVAPVTAGTLEDGVAALARGDDTTAMVLLRPLAYQGDAQAQDALGTMYYEGQGVPERHTVAAQWYRKAAKQSNRDAQATLGNMYFVGHGVPQSDATAIHWWQKAADQGDSSAQNSLGVIYENGTGVPINLALAYKWYSLAAQGDPNYKVVAKGELERVSQHMTQAQIAKAQNLARQ
jgi:uncharacterized protein